MTSIVENAPKATKKNLFKSFRTNLLLAIGLISVGAWLGFSTDQHHISMPTRAVEEKSMPVDSVPLATSDRSIIQGLRCALPLRPDGESTLPFGSDSSCQISKTTNSAFTASHQSDQTPAYLVSEANPDGMRLKTIVTR